MALVGLTTWQFLLALTVGILGTMWVVLRPKSSRYQGMIKLGLFLALFDFSMETWGALSGYWFSYQSMAFLGPAPIEVVLMALMAGATYHLIFPPKMNWALGLASSLVIACIGVIFEAALIGTGSMAYYGGWTSGHALLGYFATFMLVHAANEQVTA